VPGSEWDEARVQLVYDTVNRMVVLVGEVPFKRLFTERISSLAEHVGSRVDDAVDAGLLDDGPAVSEAIHGVARAGGDHTVEELFAAGRHELGREVTESALALRRLGVQIPIPGLGGERKREAVRRLLGAAPAMTFTDLFVVPARDVDEETIRAIHGVKRAGLLGWFANDRCCARNAGHDGVADLCSPNNSTWCNLTGMDEDTCSVGSDPCPPPKASEVPET
jgi:hypothetical protein